MSGALKTVGKILPFGVFGAIDALTSKKDKPDRPAQSLPTRDQMAADDEMRRRRGSAADTLLGPAAAAPLGATVKSLTGE